MKAFIPEVGTGDPNCHLIAGLGLGSVPSHIGCGELFPLLHNYQHPLDVKMTPDTTMIRNLILPFSSFRLSTCSMTDC